MQARSKSTKSAKFDLYATSQTDDNLSPAAAAAPDISTTSASTTTTPIRSSTDPNELASQLYLAASSGELSDVKELLSQGAPVDQPIDHTGYTPFMIAIHEGHYPIVKALLDAGSAVNQRLQNNDSALHIAARKGFDEIASLLLESGADINQIDNEGLTPYKIAAIYKHANVITELNRYDYDYLTKSSRDSLRAEWIYWAMTSLEDNPKNNHLKTLVKGILNDISTNKLLAMFSTLDIEKEIYLLERALSENRKINKDNLLHQRFLKKGAYYRYSRLEKEGGRADIANRLIKLYEISQPTVINAVNDTYNPLGCTQLYLEARSGNHNQVARLVARGARVNQPELNRGWTPLIVASYYGYDKIVSILIKAGAILDQRDNFGWTPLEYASAYGHNKIVRLLASAGAGDRENALIHAWDSKHYNVIFTLSRHDHLLIKQLPKWYSAIFIFEATECIEENGSRAYPGYQDVLKNLLDSYSSTDIIQLLQLLDKKQRRYLIDLISKPDSTCLLVERLKLKGKMCDESCWDRLKGAEGIKEFLMDPNLPVPSSTVASIFSLFKQATTSITSTQTVTRRPSLTYRISDDDL